MSTSLLQTVQLPVALPQQTATTLFDTPAFLDNWWTHLAPRFRLGHCFNGFVIHHKPVLKGLAHLRTLRLAGWNSALNQDLTTQRARTLLDLPAPMATGWDVFTLLWSQAREGLQAFDMLTQAGYTLTQTPAPTQYEVDLTLGWEGFLASRSAKTRRKIRAHLKQATPLRPHLQAFTGPRAIDTFFDLFFKHHMAYWDQKVGQSYFTHPAERQFIKAWAYTLAEKGQLCLDGLYLADTLVQLNVGVLTPTAYYGLLTINTGAHPDYYPGLLGVYLRLQQQMQAGQCQWFNLGAGESPFKQQTATHVIPCHQLKVINHRTWRGQMVGRLQNILASHHRLSQ
jgi:hypothetical protein